MCFTVISVDQLWHLMCWPSIKRVDCGRTADATERIAWINAQGRPTGVYNTNERWSCCQWVLSTNGPELHYWQGLRRYARKKINPKLFKVDRLPLTCLQIGSAGKVRCLRHSVHYWLSISLTPATAFYVPFYFLLHAAQTSL